MHKNTLFTGGHLRGHRGVQDTKENFIKKWTQSFTIGGRLQEVPAKIFDWERSVFFNRLACVAHSLEDGRLQGATAP